MQKQLGSDDPVLDSNGAIPTSVFDIEGSDSEEDSEALEEGLEGPADAIAHGPAPPIEDNSDEGGEDEGDEDGDDYEDFEDDSEDDNTLVAPPGCWLRTSQAGLFDPFEPNLIYDALILETCNLGFLIFGSTVWQRLAVKAGLPDACLLSDDPLSSYFQGLRPLGRVFF